MARERVLKVSIVGDARKLHQTFSDIERNTNRVSKTVSRFGAGLVAAFSVTSVIAGIKSTIDAAREAERVGKQTTAVLRSTGGAAKVTAREVSGLAKALMNKVAVDDDVIQAGENILLTFTKVRNETGKGNDIFNQATAAAVDLAAAMNQGEVTAEGLQRANIQLGKALNDPLKGITALQRVGVSFTKGQRDQIKVLVESGRTMDAQKIILRELRTEFAGSAEAAATPWKRLQVILGNFEEFIGGKFIRAIDAVSSFILNDLTPHLGELRKAWDRNKESILSLLKPFDAVNAKSQTADERAQSLADSMTTLTEGIGDAARFLNRLGGHLNSLQASLDVTAKAIHTKFVRPMVASFLGLVRNWLAGLHQILRITASTAEALRLPWARNLRRIEQDTKGALNAVQRRIDQLHGKTVTVKARAAVEIARSTRLYLQAANVPGFHATGGPIRGPGTGTSDSVPAMLSAGEHVWTAKEVQAAGGHGAIEAMRRSVRGYAQGGPVSDLTNRFYNPVVAATGKLGGKLAATLAASIGSGLTKALKKALGGGSPAIKAFIRSTDPLPYIWGAAGPRGYDCSGLVSAVLGKMTGRGGGHGQRYFTTSSIHSGILGIKPGLGGVLQIGVTPGQGHMAGRYGGLGFEAESSRTGIKIGAAASRVESFARHFHLAKGGAVDERLLARLSQLRGLDIGGDFGNLRVNGRSFDRGGYLPPGLSLAYNGTGRPERVGGLSREDARMIAQELAKVIPTTIRVDDMHQGLRGLRNRRRLGLGLE